MITLLCDHNPKPLGDQIDSVFLAHCISVIEKKTVNICYQSSIVNFLNDFVGFGDVLVNSSKSKTVIHFHNNKKEGIQLYNFYSSQIEKIPLQKNIETRNIQTPDKFITAQWDAQQIYRRPDKYEKERIPRIESYYRDRGYSIIRVGGEGEYKDLKEIIYVMSKASLHIGAESGMMHIAKMLMPAENLHLYRYITRRNDDRFPDGWDVAWMGRELMRRGAKLNYCENPPKEQVEYFRSLEPWV